MAANRVIGVDLGGTKILAGVVERDGTIVSSSERETPTSSQDALFAALDDVVEDQLGDGVQAIGYGIPTQVDHRTGRALGSVNIPLGNVEFGARMQERFGLPVGVENDANAAAFAEWRLGAGRGARDMLMLTLGTGVGGGAVVDGRLFREWAEFGHIVVQADGPPCQGSCTGRGHLEAVASGSAADRVAQELWGGAATAHELVDRAEAGEAEAVEALAGIGRLLGAGIGSLVNIFGSELVVVGGGFGAAAGELVLGPALEVARTQALPPAAGHIRLVEAELGTEAGLIGAALVGFQALDGER